jgi:hypothetical protein
MVGAEGEIEVVLARQPVLGNVLECADHDLAQRIVRPGS